MENLDVTVLRQLRDWRLAGKRAAPEHVALVMIDEEQPDILLLDINLNDKKDGIDLAEKVNERFRIPFIFLTAYGDKATIDRAKKMRPNAYLIKPYNKDELFAAVELAMELASGSGFYRAAGVEQAFRDIQAARYHPMRRDRQALFAGSLALGDSVAEIF